ncbi:flagellar export chaperone FliS [Alkalihalobacillus sp. LMS39]|uniref:flagellar export chaperone FliS n=1 Tax=Alkalihalobacillus sp. LMS39 TaxID=2924032 RepID=UPI001FB4164A|nr:flagellar export chaperone FliS [Alkalihalobacillus sp. LMS39]UOE93800.1 flagellar export chaperone FliS [Alkalihalobacillus sp. LMS39]
MAISNLQAAAYKQNTLNTASPGELTLMLYNGCLKFIKLSKTAMEKNDIEMRNVNINKAQDIIRELMVTLETTTDLGKNMMRMYDFILSRLVDANIKNDMKALDDAEQFVTDFRDTWKQVVQLDRQKRHGAGGQA